MLWSICILTVSRRDAKFRRLLASLLPQAEAAGDVEVVAYRNDGTGWMSHYRQAQLDDARGEYFSCVDDDDFVSDDYVSLLRTAMAGGPDCVGLWLEREHHPPCLPYRVVQGTEFGYLPDEFVQYEGRRSKLRYINHINPVRTEIARISGFPGMLWADEDDAYSFALSRYLRPAHEVMVAREVYRHTWSGDDSVRCGPRLDKNPLSLPVVDSSCFRWHPYTS